ncbi:MAG: hypothetical protein H6Q73_2614 [Firmicutes bacterium]|nr:hypothetical protein [Bacillota bacterium]
MFKQSRMAIILILVVVIASQFLLPWLVSKVVARGMAGVLGTEQVTATVEKSPAMLMLGGRFDRVVISAQNARVDRLIFAEIDAVLTDVKLDAAALISGQQLVVKSAKEVNLTASITQEELSRYLNQAVKGVKNAVVSVNGGEVKISGDFGLGKIASVAVTLEGRVSADDQKIKFVTERFLINNTLVGKIGGTALTEVPLVDLKKFPFNVVVRQITMEDGKVTVFADNHAQ